jgi:hypothetical protein
MIKKIKVDHPFYKIVSDGGMSSPSVGEGRFLPALIIDVEDTVEVTELIKLHEGIPPGDTELTWAMPDTFFSPKTISLNLKFLKPMKVEFGIDFRLNDQYSLVDGIIQSRGFYLMTGKAWDRVSNLIDESILIEVPNMEFDKKWNEMLIDILKKKYRKMGASRKDTQKHVNEHIKSMRSVWNVRRSE